MKYLILFVAVFSFSTVVVSNWKQETKQLSWEQTGLTEELIYFGKNL